MPVYKREYDYSPKIHERVMDDLDQTIDKVCAERILSIFCDAGLTIKVKHLFPDTPNAYYRVLCFIKKSAESVIINTRTDLGKKGVVNGLSIQIRIVNKNTFDMLEQFTESIRSQIIGADECRFCSEKCEEKRYEFAYTGTKYIKCRYLCSNFRLTVHDEKTVDDVITIIKNELAYKNAKKKESVKVSFG